MFTKWGAVVISPELDKTQRTIINIHRELFGESPSPMKLQKLCYYAQGYALAEGKSLFDEDFQAWQHGPVIRGLYDKYRAYQWKQISEEVGESDNELYDFLLQVVSAYGRFDGAALSTMTHRENPWIHARGGIDESAGSTAVITKESISRYFSQKLTEINEQAEKQ